MVILFCSRFVSLESFLCDTFVYINLVNVSNTKQIGIAPVVRIFVVSLVYQLIIL
mgnify:FL=1